MQGANTDVPTERQNQKEKKSAGREIRTPVPLRERALWLNNFQARALPG
jgi:hypothetical protein